MRKKFEILFGKDEKTIRYIDMNGTHYQNILVVGCAGSGKTTIMHNMIMYMMAEYSREEIELRVLDTNWYNEFVKYHEHGIRVDDISINSEKSSQCLSEYFQELSYLMYERFEFLKKNGWCGYWQVPKSIQMPRIVLFISTIEAMHMICETASEKNDILSNLESVMRLGSAVGIHIIAESQILPIDMRKSLPFAGKVIVLKGCMDMESHMLADRFNITMKEKMNFILERRNLKLGEALLYDADCRTMEKVRFPSLKE